MQLIKNKQQLFYSFALATMVTLSGCELNQTKTDIGFINDSALKASKVNKITGDISTWQVKDCKVTSKKNSVTVETDGSISHNTLRIVTKLPSNVDGFPKISLVGIGGVNINLNGQGYLWSFEIPNTPYATAQMISNRVYFVIEYTPQASSYDPVPRSKKVVVSASGFPQALVKLADKCKS